MKKQLLFGALLLGSILSVNAQDNCASALPIAVGTTNVGAIDGEYPGAVCWATGSTTPAAAAEWYVYTATADAMVRINTDLPANDPTLVDTRISVFVGECGLLECWSGSDDINPAQTGGNYLTNFTFDAHAGETYYIVFDNRWSAAPAQVELTIDATPSCPAVTPFVEDWAAEVSYYFCWAAFNPNADAMAWQWNNVNDLNGDGTDDAVAAIAPPAAPNNVAKNEWLISGGLNLVGGETYTITAKYNGFNASATVLANETLEFVMLDSQSPDATGQQVIGTAANITQQGTIATFEQSATTVTYTYVPAADGIKHLGLHATSAAASGWLMVFDVSVTGTTAGRNDVLASKLSVYPNPATNVINISNAENILVNGVQVVDLNGRVVKSVKFNGVTEAQVNVSDLANGMYMMTVSSDKGTMTQKIVKN